MISGCCPESQLERSNRPPPEVTRLDVYKRQVLNVLKQKKVISLVDEYNNTTSIATGSPIFNNNCEIVSVIVSIRDINELNIIKRELNITPRVERFYQEEMEILQNQLCICLLYTSRCV